MTTQEWEMGNLPKWSWEDIPMTTQDTVRSYDDFVRIVWNSRFSRYALVRRCGPLDGFIAPDGCNGVPGWRQFALLDHCDPMTLRRELSQRDGWLYNADRKASAREFVRQINEDFYDKQKAESDALTDEASGSAADRMSHDGRYYGPKEEFTFK